MQTSLIPYLAPIGRLMLSSIFLASALNKIMDWQQPSQMMAERGLPAVGALLAVAVALELIGGASVLLGVYARMGALALLMFLVPVSLIMHNFWAFEEGTERMAQMISFMKNVSIAGGVTMVLALGAGPCSIDRLLEPRAKPAPPPA